MSEMVELQRKADQDLNKLKFEMAAAAEAHAKRIAEIETELRQTKQESTEQQAKALRVGFAVCAAFVVNVVLQCSDSPLETAV